MPSRQPRWPSIGLASRSESILASFSSSAAFRVGFMLSASRRQRSSSISRYSLGLARNSCSGGAGSRKGAGRPAPPREKAGERERGGGGKREDCGGGPVH